MKCFQYNFHLVPIENSCLKQLLLCYLPYNNFLLSSFIIHLLVGILLYRKNFSFIIHIFIHLYQQNSPILILFFGYNLLHLLFIADVIRDCVDAYQEDKASRTHHSGFKQFCWALTFPMTVTELCPHAALYNLYLGVIQMGFVCTFDFSMTPMWVAIITFPLVFSLKHFVENPTTQFPMAS